MPNSYGFLSTYPPTQCGLATFTRSLLRSIDTPGSGDRFGVVRIIDGPTTGDSSPVVGHLDRHGGVDSAAEAAAALNTFDVAIVQHEYGIFGGHDGDQVLAVLEQLRVPTVVVVHTVLATPTAHQRQVLEQVAHASDAVVTMTAAARDRLVAGYHVDAAKVVVIPHGAVGWRGDTPAVGRRPVILTWGLLGPGKGIEWAIDGLARLRRLSPEPLYIVAGQTHPRVLEHQGEAYRRHLEERARALDVSHLLHIEGAYLDDAALNQLLARADMVLLPYDSREQVTSGVLVEAIAAGKPVVATAFPHAVELLASGAGTVVPHGDGAAIGAALYRVLTEPDQARRMATEAARLAPSLAWPAVGDRYRALASELLMKSTAVFG